MATEKIITSFTKHVRDGVTRLSATYSVVSDGKVQDENKRFDSIVMNADEETHQAIRVIEDLLYSKISEQEE